MEFLKDVGVLVQAGAVGIALVTLWILYKTNTANNGQLAKIIDRNTESNVQLHEVIGGHTEVVRSLKETMERKL